MRQQHFSQQLQLQIGEDKCKLYTWLRAVAHIPVAHLVLFAGDVVSVIHVNAILLALVETLCDNAVATRKQKVQKRNTEDSADG